VNPAQSFPLFDLSQNDAHRRNPIHPVISAFVVRRLCSVILTENAGAPGEFALPDPRFVPDGELVPSYITQAVEEVNSISARRDVASYDLDTARSDGADKPICRMKHEEAARCPFIDITGEDFRTWRTVGVDDVAFGNPMPDDGI
jgi:hypothetical protein